MNIGGKKKAYARRLRSQEITFEYKDVNELSFSIFLKSERCHYIGFNVFLIVNVGH